MDGRFAICSQAMTTGGWTSIVNPDEITLDYVRARTDEPFEPLVSDPDAVYFKTITLDASAIEPLVVVPPSRYDVRAVSEVAGIKVSKGFIGSDAGGWISDLRIAADLLRGKQLPHDIVLNITPGTVEILKQSLNEGLLEVFIDAKCVIPTPNEGMEGGKNTPLEKDDICIATSQSNYPGRMGAYTAEIYLGNAATVAASCLAGEITDPRPYLA
jgi:3-isopropylmalate/(R)-2-methylmalate dehydratase large subunit